MACPLGIQARGAISWRCASSDVLPRVYHLDQSMSNNAPTQCDNRHVCHMGSTKHDTLDQYLTSCSQLWLFSLLFRPVSSSNKGLRFKAACERLASHYTSEKKRVQYLCLPTHLDCFSTHVSETAHELLAASFSARIPYPMPLRRLRCWDWPDSKR